MEFDRRQRNARAARHLHLPRNGLDQRRRRGVDHPTHRSSFGIIASDYFFDIENQVGEKRSRVTLLLFLLSFECFAVIVRMDGVAMKRALVAGSAGNIIAASPTAVVDIALFRVRAF